MQFNHTLEQVLNGTKTQTRRLVKPRQRYADRHELGLPPAVFTVSNTSEPSPRIQWYVGQTVAVQPGRNAKGIARIQITRLRQEDVRNISRKDVIAEGFKDYQEFMHTWTYMHDQTANLWDAQNGYYQRPEDRYQAWVIDFCLIRERPTIADGGEIGE